MRAPRRRRGSAGFLPTARNHSGFLIRQFTHAMLESKLPTPTEDTLTEDDIAEGDLEESSRELQELAFQATSMKEYRMALDCYQQASIKASQLDPQHPAIIGNLGNMYLIYDELADYLSAKYVQKALHKFVFELDQIQPVHISALIKLCTAWERQGIFEPTMLLYDVAAQKIMNSIPDPTDPIDVEYVERFFQQASDLTLRIEKRQQDRDDLIGFLEALAVES